MKRVHVPEVEDMAWFPGWLRTAMTNLLVVLSRKIGVIPALRALTQRLLAAHGHHQVVDLAAGAGGPMPEVVEDLRTVPGLGEVTLLMTDRFPNADAVRAFDDPKRPHLRYVADPVDEILNDAAWILEQHVGEDQNVVDRMWKILTHTQAVREQIRTVGDSFSIDAARGLTLSPMHPELRSKRILVADADKDVRRAAHEILGRLGCVVETAHDGEEALLMARTFAYDVVLTDIRLPDMNGAEVFRRMRELHSELPVVLMTGFGYDAEHCIVKARQMGLKAVLYKPFRLDQLLKTVAEAIHSCPSDGANGNS